MSLWWASYRAKFIYQGSPTEQVKTFDYFNRCKQLEGFHSRAVT